MDSDPFLSAAWNERGRAKRQEREDYYVRKEPREVTHNAVLVSYQWLMWLVLKSIEYKKQSKETREWNCWSTAFIDPRRYTLLLHLRADAVFHTS